MLRSERMLNIEKYKEELENIGVINPNGLAVIDGKPCMCQEAECNMCELRSEESCCFYKTDNWLFSEYKEPEIDWSKVKVDTPIYVRDCETDSNGDEKTWVPRHFAKFENGTVYVWDDGGTSFMVKSEDSCSSWNSQN